MPPRKKFDVFLSHNSRDKPWVIRLKSSLETLGIKVWLDKDEIRPGDLFAKALEKGIEESKAVALVISPESMQSGWVENEYYSALRLATRGQLQLIPVLYRQAEIPGFLSDRHWVDFSNEIAYDEKVRELVWGITGEKTPRRTENKSSPRTNHTADAIAQYVNHIRNPFVRGMERKLRMGNAHWVQAGFSVPASELFFTSVYYQNQIEMFRRIQTVMQAISVDIADRKVNLLQDTFLDRVEENLDQAVLRVEQVEELLSVSGKEFDLSLTLSKAGRVILRDVEKVRKLADDAVTRLLSNARDYDRLLDSLSTELGNLAISIEEYQRHLATILNQSKLENIYLSSGAS
jgi:hypothetical protein